MSAAINPYVGRSLEDLKSERQALKHVSNKCLRIHTRCIRSIDLINQAIIDIENEDLAIEVSDHAVVRFLERSMNLDIAAIRKELASMISSENTGEFFMPHGKVGIVARDNRVVTVLSLGSEVLEHLPSKRAPRKSDIG